MAGQQVAPEAPADTRAAFFAAMSRLQAEFAAAADDIDDREAVLKKALADIRDVLEDGIGGTAFAPSHALARFMIDFNGELACLVQSWLDRINKYDRNTAFRKGFTDSLVVFVLGKVKAGKSSLGNYMAYGRSNPEGALITETRPDFFTAAMAQGAKNQTEAAVGQGGIFRVGARETTQSIQGFRVPGLTWVDSPGLHSVTPENGALASDYADVADLIVYPMHTGNPGRTGDIAEIQELRRAKKSFLVIITQCDKPEEDEEPDGTIVQHWVMKEQAARQGQIEYVRRAVSASRDAFPFNILSLSVRYAETHNNTPAALEESGIAGFFRLLTDIARSEGVRRKRETPSRNLDHFVDLVLGTDARDDTLSVARVLSRLHDLRRALASAAVEIEHRADRAVAAVLARIGPVVAHRIKRHADDKNQTDFERECTSELRQIVAEVTRTEILSLLAATCGALVPVADFTEISAFLKFESLTVKIPKSNRKTIGAFGKAGGGAAGMWAGGELGFVAGTMVPGIGNAIGATVGAALGGLLGGFVGNAAGEALGSDWEEKMQSGDNRAEVEASAVKALQDAGQAAVEGFFATLKSATIEPVGRRADWIVRELTQFSEVLKSRVHSNGRSLPARV
jgi:predicted GTPase